MSVYNNPQLTDQVIGCAYEVHNILGSGFMEKVYENALLNELISRGIKADAQRQLSVSYKGAVVGEYYADIVVEDSLIIELKAVEKLTDIHELQLKNYLKATNIELGLLINFGKSVEIKRKYVPNQTNLNN